MCGLSRFQGVLPGPPQGSLCPSREHGPFWILSLLQWPQALLKDLAVIKCTYFYFSLHQLFVVLLKGKYVVTEWKVAPVPVLPVDCYGSRVMMVAHTPREPLVIP